MNSNSFTASLTNGYGQPIGQDMLDALGLDDIQTDTPMTVPVFIAPPAKNCGRLPSPANCNLRQTG